MANPNKIMMRDLSPDLQKLISGEEVSQEYMETILKNYRKKNEVIQEYEIDVAYRNTLNSRINDLRIELENFVNGLEVISPKNLSPEFIQRIETIEAKLQALSSLENSAMKIQTIESQVNELNRLINGEVGISNQMSEINDKLGTIQQDIVALKEVDAAFTASVESCLTALAGKRDKEEKIEVDDLSDDLADKILNAGAILDQIADIAKILPNTSSFKNGQYIGVGMDGLMISKNLFWPATIVRNGEELPEMDASSMEYSVLEILDDNNYNFYCLEENVPEGGTEPVKMVSKFDNYFETETSLWNTFITDAESGNIVAIVLNNGKFLSLESDTQKKAFEHTLASGGEVTFNRPNALSHQPITIYVKSSADEDKWLLAESTMIEVLYAPDSYTLYNHTDNEVTLHILEP